MYQRVGVTWLSINDLVVMNELGDGGSDLAGHFNQIHLLISSCIMKFPRTFVPRTGDSNAALCECTNAVSGSS